MFVFSQGNNISSDNCHVINLLLPLLRDVGCLLNNTDGRWGLRGDRNQGETLDKETHKVCNRTRSTRSTLTCIFNIDTEFKVSNHHPPHHQMPAPSTTPSPNPSNDNDTRHNQPLPATWMHCIDVRPARHQHHVNLSMPTKGPCHDITTSPLNEWIAAIVHAYNGCHSCTQWLSLLIHNPSVTLD